VSAPTAGRTATALSVLDLSVLNDGQSSAEALQTTAALARRADELGYSRFWVAEHHNMPSVACTAPTVLMAHLAAVTDRIRVGSGGVMLPNHAPLVVAEQFAMLEGLHPGRIDVGIGRAPGTDQRTAAALRRSADALGAEDFPRDLLDLMGLLGDPRTETGLWQQFRATPAATSVPQVFLLGSSDYSAHLAGQLGLPFAFAHHFDMGGTLHATEIYHQQFRPSAVLDAPHLIVTANVLIADTQQDADWHAAPGRLTALGRRTGRFIRLPSPQDASVHPDLDQANRLPTSRVVGDPSTAIPALRGLVDRTGADELMVTSVAYDLSARSRSLELLAQHWPLVASPGHPAGART
jgi:luciferase family oxidoreductase group 1